MTWASLAIKPRDWTKRFQSSNERKLRKVARDRKIRKDDQGSSNMIALSVVPRRAQLVSWSSTTSKCTTKRSSTECSCIVLRRSTIVQSKVAARSANQHQLSGGTTKTKLSTASKRCSRRVFRSGTTETTQSAWSKSLSIGCSNEATFDLSAKRGDQSLSSGTAQRSDQESQIATMIAAKSMTYSESRRILTVFLISLTDATFNFPLPLVCAKLFNWEHLARDGLWAEVSQLILSDCDINWKKLALKSVVNIKVSEE